MQLEATRLILKQKLGIVTCTAFKGSMQAEGSQLPHLSFYPNQWRGSYCNEEYNKIPIPARFTAFLTHPHLSYPLTWVLTSSRLQGEKRAAKDTRSYRLHRTEERSPCQVFCITPRMGVLCIQHKPYAVLADVTHNVWFRSWTSHFLSALLVLAQTSCKLEFSSSSWFICEKKTNTTNKKAERKYKMVVSLMHFCAAKFVSIRFWGCKIEQNCKISWLTKEIRHTLTTKLYLWFNDSSFPPKHYWALSKSEIKCRPVVALITVFGNKSYL